MYENVDKYIYKVGENNYRIKIQKKDKATGLELNISENYNLKLEEVKKIRDNFINEYEEKIITLTKKSNKINNPKKEISKNQLVDKYIYYIDKGKYRIKIKKGTKGEIGYFNFNETINGTLSEARKIRDKKLAELKIYKTPSSDRGNITLEEFIKIFLENHTADYSPTTLSNVKNKINYYILPALGKYKLNKLNVLIMQNFISNLIKQKKKNKKEENISITTVNTIYRTLRNILNRAVDWEYIEKNPLLKVKTPAVDTKEKNTLNLEELIEVIKCLKKEDIELQCLAMIVITTGLRRGELLGIHLEDIDIEEGIFYIKHNVVRDQENHKVIETTPKTRQSIREVPFPEMCREILLKYLDHRKDKIEIIKKINPNYKEISNIFLNEFGDFMNPDYPPLKWKKFLKKNNLKVISFHEVRHSYCSLQVNDNKELGIKDVASLLGHSQLSTTFHYSHANRDKKDKILSIFDKLQEGKKFHVSTILSICKNKPYCSSSKINELIDYVVDNKELDNIERYEICRLKLIESHPSINNIDDSKVNINNIFNWLEEVEKQYGTEIYVNKEDKEFKKEELKIKI